MANRSTGSVSTFNLIQAALGHHQAGRLGQAEAIYRQILQVDPNQPDALHLSGAIARQLGNRQAAADFISRAIKAKPSEPVFHNSLGLVLKDLGRLDEATASYRRAIKLNADYLEAYYNLGNVLQLQGRPDEAASSYRKALALKPGYPEAHCNLGSALQAQGKLDEATSSYRKALSIRPDYVEAHCNLGNALQEQGRMDEAVACYRQALALKPDYVKARSNLGKALQQQGKFDEATDCYRQALALRPDIAEMHCNLGGALRGRGALDESIACYRQALALKPDFAEALTGLAIASSRLGHQDEAIACFRRALSINPNSAEAHDGLGTALRTQGKLQEAIDSYHRALALRPGYAKAYNNLGFAHQLQGNLDAALECFRKALSINPDMAEAHSNLLFSMTHHPACTPSEYLAEARRFGSTVSARAKPYTQWRVPAAKGEAHPLRVGLVSGDLRTHPVGFFLQNILARLDPARVELFAYSMNPDEDALTACIKPRFAAWSTIAQLGDEAAARKIHADGIHVLVDLAGHTGYNRLPMFAWKPAPVQVSWLGYWASTGVPAIDYLLADEVSVPESDQAHFSETIWCLPDTRMCFAPPADSSQFPVSSLPRLQNGYLTFGSFQKLAKINDQVLALWSRVLNTLPDARLRVQNKQMNCAETCKQFQLRMAQLGIAPERVTLVQSASREAYLAAYAGVDIVLDTFPFPGGTTTCDALWMGVPTLTLAGNTLVGRQGVSMLSCAGLGDWIAADQDDFVARAIAHAGDEQRLAQLRAQLRQQALDSPLFDGARFASNLEYALFEIWRKQ